MIIKKLIVPICYASALCCVPFSTILYATDTIDQLREKSVALIKAGQTNTALVELERLLNEYPNNQKLIADYVVVSYANKNFKSSDIKYLEGINVESYPEYGQVSLVKALRDLKQIDLAKLWCDQFYKKTKKQEWLVWIAVLEVESGNQLQAKNALSKVKIDQLSADYLSQASYSYRLLNMPIEALNTGALAVARKQNNDTEEQYVLALISNGDYAKAEKILDKSQLLTLRPELQHLVKLSEFSQRIQNAVQYYSVMNYKNRGNEDFIFLDQVIEEMSAYETHLPQNKTLRQRFYYDYIYALDKRNHPRQAIAQITKTGLAVEQMPPYVREALANSYLKLKQPKMAEKYYKSLLNEKNYPDMNVYSGLYYALLEQNKYQESNQLIIDLDKRLPIYKYSNAKGVDRSTDDDRLEYIALVGLNYAYQNQLDKAEKYFQDLVKLAPNNVLYQNNLAQIQRWREKPETSEDTLAQWNGLEPVDRSTQINHMLNMQAMDHIAEWRKLNQQLLQSAPYDTGVLKSKKELADRNHASIQHQSTFSKSRSDHSGLLDRLKGSRELESDTTVNSPWFYDNYRAFVNHAYRKGNYELGKLDEQRLGIGLEWAADRKLAKATISQNVDGEHLGLQLDWSHWLNDHWQYVLGFNSQAAIPLQAVDRGYEGKSYNVALNWKENESRKAGIGYQFTDIDDGNDRQELAVYFRQQFFQRAKHTSSAMLSGYLSHNSNIPTQYFNPEHSQSFELTLEHDWMTWRNNNNQSFNQHFEVTAGNFWQKSYSSKPIYNLLYRHDWELSRTWRLNYGIGWGVHPYDGENERRAYALLGFEGRF
nr:poly-beta-1,6 N-acetyl-D-glucosamine export porin PgaA [Acinetobacter sp. Marseille-Q1620]